MVFVLDKHKKPLMPCTEKRARQLLEKKRAVIHKMFPFTIRLKDRTQEESELQDIRLKLDPGAKTTGIAILTNENVILLGELQHKTTIKKNLESRRTLRRGRRNRKTRYRKPRFLNRTRNKGWLPPSLEARVDQTLHLVEKFKKLMPITDISSEHVKFDTQLLDNPNIEGVEYQQGELAGYEIREYLLEKFDRKCVYCGKKDVPLEIEHLIPKARGGSNRLDNLAIACRECNAKKGTQTAKEFGFPELMVRAKKPLKEAAFMNATRWRLYERLKNHVPVECGSGALTKMNRIRHGLPKEHYYDAACVGFSTPNKLNTNTKYIQEYKYMGRGKRQMCRTDAYGFPKAFRQRKKNYFGFYTGDIVKADKPKGKGTGEHLGRLTVNSKPGNFVVNGVTCHAKYIRLIQRNDGWKYDKQERSDRDGRKQDLY